MDEAEFNDYVWFSESVKRYNELVMFEMEYPVQQLDLSDDSDICLLSQKTLNQLISLYKLPAKMAKTNMPNGNYITQSSSDIKFCCGIFPKLKVLQVLALYGENKIITSEDSLGGVNVYEFDSSREDTIKKKGNVTAPLKGAKISLLDQNTVILAKDALQDVNIVDLESENISKVQPDLEESEKITPCCISNSLCCFSKSDGSSTIRDIKSKAVVAKIPGMIGEWNTSSNYSYKINKEFTLMGLVSKTGDYRIFDARWINKELLKGNFDINTNNHKTLKLTFSPNSKSIALSGHNGTIDVYGISHEVQKLFCHDGHKYMENCDKNTTVTDHLWYDNDCIISVADNTSLIAASFSV